MISCVSLTIVGQGFATDKDNLITFSDTHGRTTSSNMRSAVGASLTATVPSYPPGIYSVQVQNAGGVSNTKYFTITGVTSS
ncbi:MAG: IPT/TIG domain-containing protein [Patescibacteria group bacterium]|nr:IPT/TIG domain-containing protein [Patescibacteria group bacterium]